MWKCDFDYNCDVVIGGLIVYMNLFMFCCRYYMFKYYFFWYVV